MMFVSTPLVAVLLLAFLQPVAGNCGGLQGDVIFILDASGSVGYSNFQTMLQFVNDLIDDFDIGSDNVRVGVVKYASYVWTEMNLNSYYDKTSLKNAVSAISYTGGSTNTGGGIAHMTSNMFTTANGDRSNIPDVGIVITDGFSDSSSYTTSQAALARSQGITMFAIGVGTGVTELNSIATDPDSDHVFTVTSFSGLASIESSFQTKACTSTVFTASATNTTSSAPAEATADNTAAVVGGVVGAVAAVGAAGAVGALVYTKLGKTLVSKLAQSSPQANPESGQQNDRPQDNDQPQDNEPSIPGMTVDAPTSMQPASTHWPARLPPINRF